MDLKDAARHVGLTGTEIARKMSVTEATVSRWLSRRDAISPRYMRRLAELLRINVADLLPPE